MSQSEKICKQLGIRPLFIYHCEQMKVIDDLDVRFFVRKMDKHGIYSARKNWDNKPKVIKVEKIYPDMTQPGNFVRFAQVFPREIGEAMKDWSLRGMLEKRNLREYTIDRAVNALDDTAELDSDIKTNLDIIEWNY